MKILGVIPARYGASRFPGKPLAMILGKPMILHVYDRVIAATSLTSLVIATDDERIIEVARQHGAQAIMTRSDHATGTDRIAEVASRMECDVIVNIQGDEPLMEPLMIDQVVAPFLSEPDLPMSTLKKRLTNPDDIGNPNVVKVVTDLNHNAVYFSRATIPRAKKGMQLQAADDDTAIIEPALFKHIGIYAYRKEFLLKLSQLPMGVLEKIEELEQLRVLENGYRIKVVETSFETIAVDEPEDVGKVEQEILSRRQKE